MSGTISVVNGSNQVMSVHVDGEALFPDILPGECTEKKPVPAGTRYAQVFNSHEKIAADIRFSVPKNMHVVLKISGKHC